MTRPFASLSAPETFGRPEWLQREIAAMDQAAFPGIDLKLSYELSLPVPVAGSVVAVK